MVKRVDSIISRSTRVNNRISVDPEFVKSMTGLYNIFI